MAFVHILQPGRAPGRRWEWDMPVFVNLYLYLPEFVNLYLCLPEFVNAALGQIQALTRRTWQHLLEKIFALQNLNFWSTFIEDVWQFATFLTRRVFCEFALQLLWWVLWWMHVTAGRTLKMRIKSARLGVMRVNLGAGVEVAAERGTKQQWWSWKGHDVDDGDGDVAPEEKVTRPTHSFGLANAAIRIGTQFNVGN